MSLFPLKDLPAAWPWFERLGTGRAWLSPGPNPKPPAWALLSLYLLYACMHPTALSHKPLTKVLAGWDVGARKVSQPAHHSAHLSQCHMSQRSKEMAAGADSWLPSSEAMLPQSLCDGASVSPSAQWASQAHHPDSFEVCSVPTALHSHPCLSFLPEAPLPLKEGEKATPHKNERAPVQVDE